MNKGGECVARTRGERMRERSLEEGNKAKVAAARVQVWGLDTGPGPGLDRDRITYIPRYTTWTSDMAGGCAARAYGVCSGR